MRTLSSLSLSRFSTVTCLSCWLRTCLLSFEDIHNVVDCTAIPFFTPIAFENNTDGMASVHTGSTNPSSSLFFIFVLVLFLFFFLLLLLLRFLLLVVVVVVVVAIIVVVAAAFTGTAAPADLNFGDTGGAW